MILLQEPSRILIQAAIDSLRMQAADHPGREKKEVTKLDLISVARDTLESWNYGVWPAVQLGVGFRLPHELRYQEKYYGNCGEQAAFLYAFAKELKLGNPQFILYKQFRHSQSHHACVVFEYDGKKYIADPGSPVTSDFELRPRRIVIGGDLFEHHGLRCLSERELHEFIEKMRGEKPMLRLFGSGQKLIEEETTNGAYEIFITVHQRRSPYTLPTYRRGPTLEVILTRDEPYKENTGVAMIYDLTQRTASPLLIQFYDRVDLNWGEIDGTNMGSITGYGTDAEIRMNPDADAELTNEEFVAVVAYLDYRKAVEAKAARQRKSPEKVYLRSRPERDVVARLQREIAKLKVEGKGEEADKRQLTIGEWDDTVRRRGEGLYQRHCDFMQSTLWPYEKRNEREVTGPYLKDHLRQYRAIGEYVRQKHLAWMEQMLAEHGDKINLVREKVIAEL